MGSKPNRTPRYWAVIAAAGSGVRMRAQRPKQYLQVHGRSLIEHSLAAFLPLAWIDGVVAVLAPGDDAFARLPAARDPRLHTAEGGATRAGSVLAGLRRVSQLAAGGDAGTYVLVHDAARPCVIRADIERLRDSASDDNGGLLAIPLADTLKRAGDGQISHTVDRAGLWRAQTPQMFRLDLLRAALEDCAARAQEVTDEAGAMEARGHRPLLVAARESNIKVTCPEDLALAGFWLSRPEPER